MSKLLKRSVCVLPEEILLIILFLVDPKDLFSLCLCSHQFYSLTIPIIYAEVQPKSITALENLTATLREHPKWVGYMKFFSLASVHQRWSKKYDSTITAVLTQLSNQTADMLSPSRLETLELDHCFFLSHTTLQPLIHRHSRLRSLDLESCILLSSSVLVEILKLTTHMESINLAKVSDLDDTVLQALAKLPRLRHVNICGAENITHSGFMNFLETCSTNVTEVDCRECTMLSLHPQLLIDIKEKHGIILTTDLFSDEDIIPWIGPVWFNDEINEFDTELPFSDADNEPWYDTIEVADEDDFFDNDEELAYFSELPSVQSVQSVNDPAHLLTRPAPFYASGSGEIEALGVWETDEEGWEDIQ